MNPRSLPSSPQSSKAWQLNPKSLLLTQTHELWKQMLAHRISLFLLKVKTCNIRLKWETTLVPCPYSQLSQYPPGLPCITVGARMEEYQGITVQGPADFWQPPTLLNVLGSSFWQAAKFLDSWSNQQICTASPWTGNLPLLSLTPFF